MIINVVISASAFKRSASRNMQVAAFAVLPSVSSKEKIFVVLQCTKMSTCTDVMDGCSWIILERYLLCIYGRQHRTNYCLNDNVVMARLDKSSLCFWNVASVLAFIKSVYAFDRIFSHLGDFSYTVNQEELITVWVELNRWLCSNCSGLIFGS